MSDETKQAPAGEDEAQARLDAIEKRRAARLAGLDNARKLQQAKDEEAIEALCEEHGDDAIGVEVLQVFKPGLPTRFAVLRPSGAIGRRHNQKTAAGSTATQREASFRELGDASRVYPDDDGWKAMKEAFQGLQMNAGVRAALLMDGKREHEKKE